MIKRVIHFFDKLEDYIRGHLSRYPLVYTLISAFAIVLFWRGVWYMADFFKARGGVVGFFFSEPVSLLIVTAVLLATGLFVSYFVGDSILISGLRSEKKINEKTAKEVEEEEVTLMDIENELQGIKKELDEIKGSQK